MIQRIKALFKDAHTRTDYYDYNLLAVIILLIAFGLIILFSASAYDAATGRDDSLYYLRHQAIISGIAVVGCIVVSRFDYHVLAKVAGILYLVSLVLMGLVATSLGVTVNGAKRWLKIGLQFQPSEIAKIAIIIFIPYLIILMGRKLNTFRGTFLLIFVGAVPAVFAWIFTDNLSTGIIIGAITMVIIYVSHPKSWPFAIMMLLVIAVAVAVVIYASTLDGSAVGGFRLRRVQVWLHPEDYSDYGGYQVIQGLYAIGSGGFFGKGLGNSAQKLSSIPEAQNDMIFAIICEELGIFGMLLVLFLFGYLLYRLFFVAQNAPDLFGSLMVTGVMAHIALQVILNIAVVINLIPTTGITLPFFSYGGTSSAFLMMELAIVLSVSRKIRFKD